MIVVKIQIVPQTQIEAIIRVYIIIETKIHSFINLGEWTPCTVSCGGGGARTRLVDGSDEVEACGDKACAEYGQWSSWSDCSVTCGEGFM